MFRQARMFEMFAALACLLLAAQAVWAEPAGGDALRAAMSGNTVQGEMILSGRYTEYYAPDGSIHGQDYGGTWRIRDDRMCFKYGEEPATCYQAEIDGTEVSWLKDGQSQGTGTIVAGNPNKY